MLTDNDTYKVLYEDNQDLVAYYNAARLGRNIQNVLKNEDDISSTEVNDILFYVVYAVAADKLRKKELAFSDVRDMKLESISKEDIISVAREIYARYKELGGNSKIAKSKTFIDEIYTLFRL